MKLGNCLISQPGDPDFGAHIDLPNVNKSELIQRTLSKHVVEAETMKKFITAIRNETSSLFSIAERHSKHAYDATTSLQLTSDVIKQKMSKHDDLKSYLNDMMLMLNHVQSDVQCNVANHAKILKLKKYHLQQAAAVLYFETFICEVYENVCLKEKEFRTLIDVLDCKKIQRGLDQRKIERLEQTYSDKKRELDALNVQTETTTTLMNNFLISLDQLQEEEEKQQKIKDLLEQSTRAYYTTVFNRLETMKTNYCSIRNDLNGLITNGNDITATFINLKDINLIFQVDVVSASLKNQYCEMNNFYIDELDQPLFESNILDQQQLRFRNLENENIFYEKDHLALISTLQKYHSFFTEGIKLSRKSLKQIDKEISQVYEEINHHQEAKLCLNKTLADSLTTLNVTKVEFAALETELGQIVVSLRQNKNKKLELADLVQEHITNSSTCANELQQIEKIKVQLEEENHMLKQSLNSFVSSELCIDSDILEAKKKIHSWMKTVDKVHDQHQNENDQLLCLPISKFEILNSLRIDALINDEQTKLDEISDQLIDLKNNQLLVKKQQLIELEQELLTRELDLKEDEEQYRSDEQVHNRAQIALKEAKDQLMHDTTLLISITNNIIHLSTLWNNTKEESLLKKKGIQDKYTNMYSPLEIEAEKLVLQYNNALSVDEQVSIILYPENKLFNSKLEDLKYENELQMKEMELQCQLEEKRMKDEDKKVKNICISRQVCELKNNTANPLNVSISSKEPWSTNKELTQSMTSVPNNLVIDDNNNIYESDSKPGSSRRAGLKHSNLRHISVSSSRSMVPSRLLSIRKKSVEQSVSCMPEVLKDSRQQSPSSVYPATNVKNNVCQMMSINNKENQFFAVQGTKKPFQLRHNSFPSDILLNSLPLNEHNKEKISLNDEATINNSLSGYSHLNTAHDVDVEDILFADSL